MDPGLTVRGTQWDPLAAHGVGAFGVVGDARAREAAAGGSTAVRVDHGMGHGCDRRALCGGSGGCVPVLAGDPCDRDAAVVLARAPTVWPCARGGSDLRRMVAVDPLRISVPAE